MSPHMSDNPVSLGRHRCPVCLKSYDSGEILIARSLTRTLPRATVTDWGEPLKCPTCMPFAQDRIALIGIEPDKSDMSEGISGLYRTGETAWIREQVYKDMFSSEEQADNKQHLMEFSLKFRFAPCDTAVIAILVRMQEEGEREEQEEQGEENND